MAGTVILTGANGSLAIPAVHHLLTTFPQYHAVLTVRKPASSADEKTKQLREAISRHPGSEGRVSIRALDLADLSAVHAFADTVAQEVASGQIPPISSIICNAYYWNMVDPGSKTADRLETTIQVNFVSHAALVLRLLGSFSRQGRVVFLSSDAIEPGKNGLQLYPPGIPTDLDDLANLDPLDESDPRGRGFLKYANSKLVTTVFFNALNRWLEKDPKLAGVTAVFMNPGNLVDSRALRTNTPPILRNVQTYMLKPLWRVLKLVVDPTLRTAAQAGVDVIDLAVGKAHPGERGFYVLLKEQPGPPETLDQVKQEKVWFKALNWARITQTNTALQEASKGR